MFDFAYDYTEDISDTDQVDQQSLEAKLAHMSDAELSALEDDLDFCSFAGMPSARVLDVLKDMIKLDAGWQKIHATRAMPNVPAIF